MGTGKWWVQGGELKEQSELGRKKNSCLVVLHRPPLIFENWKKVFTVQKYTAPNFQNSKKVCFFLWEFWSFKNILKLLFSTCLHFNTGFKLLYKVFFGKVDLFEPLLGDIEAIIPSTLTLIWKKKKSARPPLLIKSCGGQPNNYFFRPYLTQSSMFLRGTAPLIKKLACFVLLSQNY